MRFPKNNWRRFFSSDVKAQHHTTLEFCNPGALALSHAQWFFHSWKADKEGHIHAGCDRSIAMNANPARWRLMAMLSAISIWPALTHE